MLAKSILFYNASALFDATYRFVSSCGRACFTVHRPHQTFAHISVPPPPPPFKNAGQRRSFSFVANATPLANIPQLPPICACVRVCEGVVIVVPLTRVKPK